MNFLLIITCILLILLVLLNIIVLLLISRKHLKPLFRRFLRKLAESASLKKRPKLMLGGSGKADSHTLIESFKHPTCKSCDFCGNPAEEMIAYDFGDAFGGEVFCCHSCELAGKTAAMRPFSLCADDPDVKRLLLELESFNSDEELPPDEK